MGAFSCYGCEQRHPGCHSTCNTYREEKALRDQKLEAFKKQQAVEIGVNNQKKDGVIRANRRNGRK